ncbi:MAG: glutamate synthase [Pseudomonadota bacterium]
MSQAVAMEERVYDLNQQSVRDLNQALHDFNGTRETSRWRVLNPKGEHAIACGLDNHAEVIVEGHVGYYCAGMNQHASVTVNGNAGTGLAENMMSGVVRITGNASQSAGATGHGGLLVIDGDAAARCGISLKGLDIVVKGSVGHMSGFMAQKGTIVICGDAGAALGDSIYEAEIFLAGNCPELGADCEEKPMSDDDRKRLIALLDQAGGTIDPNSFRKFGSARKLYNFSIDNADAYA